MQYQKAALILGLAMAAAAFGQSQPARRARTQFEVTYVAADVLYLDGGSEEGLAEGMELDIKRLEPGQPLLSAKVIGNVRIIATAAQSAVCEVVSTTQAITKGDFAALSSVDAEKVSMLMTSEETRRYAQIISFSDLIDGLNPLEDEQRAYVPRPKLQEINRVRGRISMQQSSLFDHRTSSVSNQSGVSIRANVTRINGTYWNFGGNWRGRVNSRQRGPDNATLTDLINRTYQIGLTYENPTSRNRMGFGRLILPWASSLATIDGGYYGRRLSPSTTVGAFAGSMPDPTAWNYDPNRQIAGVFSSFEKGRFDEVRYSGTVGMLCRRNWLAERQFAFVQNTVSLQRKLSVYHNAGSTIAAKGASAAKPAVRCSAAATSPCVRNPMMWLAST
ncbi:MAG: hypothetical protein R2748_16345 [Bryobacterales bacterium]